MNAFASSECSSGCESGWTLYFEQSFLSANPSRKDRKGGFCSDEHREFNRGKEEVDVVVVEEDDLSMVSDASSGPPHNFCEDHNNNDHNNNGYVNDVNRYQYTATRGAIAANKSGGKSRRHRNKAHRLCREDDEQKQLPSFLDDTASSPLIRNNFSISNNQASMESVFDYSQGYPATHFQGESAFQGHYGFWQSSPSGNQLQNNQW